MTLCDLCPREAGDVVRVLHPGDEDGQRMEESGVFSLRLCEECEGMFRL